MSWELSQDNLQQIGVQESVHWVLWLVGKGFFFQPKVFGAKKNLHKQQKNVKEKFQVKGDWLRKVMFYVDLCRNLLPKSYQNAGSPCPTVTFSATFRRMRFGKKMVSFPPKKWAFSGPLPQGNGLGSISCGDYDFQEGVLSSRCFGWTPGPFHQRRKTEPIPGGCWFFGDGNGMWRKKCCKSPKVGWSLIVSELNFLGDGQLNLWWELVEQKGTKLGDAHGKWLQMLIWFFDPPKSSPFPHPNGVKDWNSPPNFINIFPSRPPDFPPPPKKELTIFAEKKTTEIWPKRGYS